MYVALFVRALCPFFQTSVLYVCCLLGKTLCVWLASLCTERLAVAGDCRCEQCEYQIHY